MRGPGWRRSWRIAVVAARCPRTVDEADCAKATPGGPAEKPLRKQRPPQSQLRCWSASEGEMDKRKERRMCYSHKIGRCAEQQVDR
jgi:hypothetical protein